jgi:transcriptional regulator with XRE-family HTH domain
MTFFLGQRIKHLRKNKGLTQFDLEKRTGIKREYLSKIENDELNNPTFSTLLKICEGIGIPITELLSGEDELPARKEPHIRIFSDLGESKDLADRIDKGDFQVIPIINAEFAAGNPKYISQNDVVDYAVIHSGYLDPAADQHRYRCIYVKDDDLSMYPLIEPRSIICIDSEQRDPQALNRQIVVLRDSDGLCAIRYLRLERNCILGVPENIKEYSPLIFSANKQNLVLGRVVWYQSAKTCSC